MKKISILSILAICLILTGCGTKKMECVYTSSNSQYGSDNMNARFIFKKDGTIDKYTMIEEMTYNTNYLKAANTTVEKQYETAKEYCEKSVPKNDKIKCNVRKYKNSVTVTIDYYLSDMDEKDISELNISEYIKAKYDDIKTQYENQGFTCK
ncbi:MAG: hypothetical protein IKN87_03260 [Bacilli bacterium]|nr:hypothetical protein [Bacilli bacterium]